MKADVLKCVARWATLVVAIAALIISLCVNARTDFQLRASEAVADLGNAIEAIEEREKEGEIFTDDQREALTLAAEKKRDARHLRNSGNYKESVKTADEGLNILEENFSARQFPELYYPPRGEWWRDII